MTQIAQEFLDDLKKLCDKYELRVIFPKHWNVNTIKTRKYSVMNKHLDSNLRLIQSDVVKLQLLLNIMLRIKTTNDIVGIDPLELIDDATTIANNLQNGLEVVRTDPFGIYNTTTVQVPYIKGA